MDYSSLWRTGRITSIALALIAVPTLSSAQTKGIFLVNESTGNARSGEVLAWRMNNDGSFNNEVVYDYAYGDRTINKGCIGTGDFNGDGWTDALWHVSNKLRIVMQVAGTNWGIIDVDQTIDAGLTPIGVGDFNGDTKPNVLMSNAQKVAIVWQLGGANGNVFQSAISLDKTVKNGTDRFVGFTDVNGDGMADIVLQRSMTRLEFWKSTGTDVDRAINGKPVQYALTELRKQIGKYGRTRVIGSLDVDGDGISDLVCRYRNDSNKFESWVLLNDGT